MLEGWNEEAKRGAEKHVSRVGGRKPDPDSSSRNRLNEKRGESSLEPSAFWLIRTGTLFPLLSVVMTASSVPK